MIMKLAHNTSAKQSIVSSSQTTLGPRRNYSPSSLMRRGICPAVARINRLDDDEFIIAAFNKNDRRLFWSLNNVQEVPFPLNLSYVNVKYYDKVL